MAISYFYGALFGVLSALFSLTASAQPVDSQGSSTYRLSSGDIIRISVYGEPDLSFEETRLTDAGTFSYPFVGEVKAQGDRKSTRLNSSHVRISYAVFC